MLLTVRALEKSYAGAEGRVPVLRGIDMEVAAGETLALTGESGSGKSTLAKAITGLVNPTAGHIGLGGEILPPGKSRTRNHPSRQLVQMIFQDPFASLNPRMRVEDIIGEAPRIHGLVSAAETSDYVDDVMKKVGLDPSLKKRYAHQFSGGQRQRIGIARALAVKPKFLVCDEAIAALDVSIQAQVINLFMDLRTELGLTYLFISHDLSVVEHIADRVAIMYLGRIVESAPTEEIFANPRHPYTKALLAEAPRLDQRQRVFEPIIGEIPSPLDPPPGCHFNPRCPLAQEICRTEAPKLQKISEGRHASCHFWDQT